MFKFDDGNRGGTLVNVGGQIMLLLLSVAELGDYIASVTGNQLMVIEAWNYLCHTLNLLFASGQSMLLHRIICHGEERRGTFLCSAKPDMFSRRLGFST